MFNEGRVERLLGCGLIGGLLLAAAPALSAGFDCAKASTHAEKAICADKTLSQLDSEVTRLYRLAEKSPHAKADQLKAMQIGFIKGREDCWKAEDFNTCLRDVTVTRIAELRQGYAEARGEDEKGISNGPFALSCPGFDFGISITFVNPDDPVAHAAWLENSVVLPLVPSGSGSHYEGRIAGEEYSIWTKGQDATVQIPDKPEQTDCQIEEIG